MHNYRVSLIITLLFSSILHLHSADLPEYWLIAEDGSSIITNSPIAERSEYFKKILEDPHSLAKDGHADGPMIIPVPVSNAEVHEYLNGYTHAHSITDGDQQDIEIIPGIRPLPRDSNLHSHANLLKVISAIVAGAEEQ